MRKVKVGVVGCGGICRGTYMDNMMYKFEVIDVVACADLIDSRAQYMVDKYGIKKMTVEEMRGYGSPVHPNTLAARDFLKGMCP